MINTDPACILEPKAANLKGISLGDFCELVTFASLPLFICRTLKETDPKFDRRNLLLKEAAKTLGLETSDLMDIITQAEMATQITIEKGIPEPIPFDTISQLPDFPLDCIPDEIGRQMIEEVSKVIQVDQGFVVAYCLGVLATTAQKKILINLTTHVEPANLYIAAILPSGERKSSAVRAMSEPVYIFQKNRQAATKSQIAKISSEKKMKEKQMKKLQEDAVKAKTEKERSELTKQAD